MGNTLGCYKKDQYVISDLYNDLLVRCNSDNKQFIQQLEQIIKNKEYTQDDYTKIKIPQRTGDYHLNMIYGYISLLLRCNEGCELNDVRMLASNTIMWCDKYAEYTGVYNGKAPTVVTEYIRSQTNTLMAERESEKVKIYERYELAKMLGSVYQYDELESNLKKNLYTRSELEDLIKHLKILIIEDKMLSAMKLYSTIENNARQEEMKGYILGAHKSISERVAAIQFTTSGYI